MGTVTVWHGIPNRRLPDDLRLCRRARGGLVRAWGWSFSVHTSVWVALRELLHDRLSFWHLLSHRSHEP